MATRMPREHRRHRFSPRWLVAVGIVVAIAAVILLIVLYSGGGGGGGGGRY
jgi:hypothetical protein